MDGMNSEEEKLEIYQRLHRILESLNKVTHELEANQDSAADKALLELQSASTSIISGNPHLFTIAQHLSQLTDVVQDSSGSKPSNHGIRSFIASSLRSLEFSRHSAAIKSEVETCIDREVVSSLKKTLSELRSFEDASSLSAIDEDKLCDKMYVLEERISRGFDINLQDLLLRSGIFSELVWLLCSPNFSKMVCEKAASSLQRLVVFNKDVFVGSVLVGGSMKALVSMDSLCSLQVLLSLIKAIKSPLVDEFESCGGILKIVGYLSSEDMEMRIMALDCIMEIGYCGWKEAVEVMLKSGLIKRLVELQGSAVTADGSEKSWRGGGTISISHLQAVWHDLQCSWRSERDQGRGIKLGSVVFPMPILPPLWLRYCGDLLLENVCKMGNDCYSWQYVFPDLFLVNTLMV